MGEKVNGDINLHNNKKTTLKFRIKTNVPSQSV